jgi:hypothetical protein
MLGQTTLERIGWVLRARDLLGGAIDSTAMATHLDTVLLQLSAAFDGAAKVTAIGLGVSGDAGWRKESWRRSLVGACPEFRAHLSKHSAVRDAIDIVSLPRSTVHDAGMPHLGVARQLREAPRTAMRIPRGEGATRFLAAITRRGGRAEWGVSEVVRGVHVLEALLFTDRCISAALSALDSLMAVTPVEQFPGVDAGGLRALRRSNKGPTDPWSEWSRRRTLLVLGLLDELGGVTAPASQV